MLEKNLGKAKGGHARAKALTAAQRSEIARKAAETRWGTKLPKVLCEGFIYFGNVSINAAVLDDGRRLLSNEHLSSPIADTGVSYVGRDGNQRDALVTEHFAAMVMDLSDSGLSPIADKIVAKVPTADAEPVNVELLTLHLSKQVDEATGYKKVLQQQHLFQHLSRLLPDYQMRWCRVLPARMWEKLLALRGECYQPEKTTPHVWQQLADDVQNVVFQRLGTDVSRQVESQVPVSSGVGIKRAKGKIALPQMLGSLDTAETYGAPKLMTHVENCLFLVDVVLADTSLTAEQHYGEFIAMLDRVRPLIGSNLQLQF